VSLKQIIVFIIFALLSIYIAFLNPHDSVIHITQHQSMKLPTVLLLLGSILIGTIITIFMFWTFNFKNILMRWKIRFKNNSISKNNNKVETLFKNGEALFICRKTDKAKKIIEKLLDASPEHIEGLNLMGRILSSTGKADQAEVFHKKALSFDPNNIHTLFNLVDTYSQIGRQGEEVATLQKIQVVNPGTLAPLLRLREVYLKQRDWKKVCALQKRIISLLRDSNEERKKEQNNLAKFFFELGRESLKTGNSDNAISQYRKAISTSEQYFPAYLSLGDAYLKSGREKQAFKIWKVGFQKTSNKSCLVRLQIALRESDKYHELIKMYEKCLESNTEKDQSVIVLLLSTLYIEHGLLDKAVILLENNTPQHPLLHSLLLETAQDSGNGKTASHFELIRDAIFSLPANQACLFEA
jgi:lipopolysaccharide assembly protein B